MNTVMAQMCIALMDDSKITSLIYNDILYTHLLNKAVRQPSYDHHQLYYSFDNYRLVFEELGLLVEYEDSARLMEWYSQQVDSICENSFPYTSEKLRDMAYDLLKQLKLEVAKHYKVMVECEINDSN